MAAQMDIFWATGRKDMTPIPHTAEMIAKISK
jgi:hypothetical protein